MTTERIETVREPFPLRWWMAVAVFVPALLLRLYNFHLVQLAVDDTALNAPNAAAFWRAGLLAPDNWWTPPLKHLTLYPSILLLGDDPVGWRLRSVLLGALTVWLVFLVVRELPGTLFAAFAAAGLLALDPLSVLYARSTTEDVLSAALVLAAVLALLRATRTGSEPWTLVTGLLMGLSLSARWYNVFPLVVGALYWVTRERVSPARLARLAVYFALVPVTVYAVAYLPWLLRGNTLLDLLALHVDGVRSQTGLQFARLERLQGPIRWLFGYIGAAEPLWSDATRSVRSATMTNPPVWLLFGPAHVWAFVDWRRNGRTGPALVAASFLSAYLFFVLSPRPIYVYSAVGIVPLAFVVLGDALSAVPKPWRYVALGVLLVWCAYLYPLTSAIVVPNWLYPVVLGG